MLKNIALISNNYEIVYGFRSIFSRRCKIVIFTSFLALKKFLNMHQPDYILVDFHCVARVSAFFDFLLPEELARLYVIADTIADKMRLYAASVRTLLFPDDIPLLFADAPPFSAATESALAPTDPDLLPEQRETVRRFVGVSSVAQNIRMQMVRAAQGDLPVLITGETGVGKGLVAELTHLLSARKNRPLQKLNVTTIPEGLSESVLFGTVRGAFTDAVTRAGVFEHAHGTTLFLDEIGDLKPAIQAKLLSVIESGRFQSLGSNTEKAVDVRLMFATNADLKTKIADGSFRADLYYRISHILIRIPPLRERKEDIVPIARAFLASSGKRLAPRAEAVLTAFDWPGNIRQLHNCLERAQFLSDSDVIGTEHIVLD